MALLVLRDQGLLLVAAVAVVRVVEDADVAGAADRPSGPVSVHGSDLSAGGAGAGGAGPAGAADEPALGVLGAGADLAAGGAWGGGRGRAVPAKVGAVGSGPADDLLVSAAVAAGPAGLGQAAVAGRAERPGRAEGLGATDVPAGGAGVCGRGPTGFAERLTVRAAGDGHPQAPAASTLLDDLRVLAIAGVADATFVTAGEDPGGSAAARARLLVPRASGSTCLADPAGRPVAGQRNPYASAVRATGRGGVGVTGGEQGPREADDHSRATRVARGKRVRVDGKVLIELPQDDAVIGLGLLQRCRCGLRIQAGQGGGERIGDPDAAFVAFLGPPLVPRPAAHSPGRRIVVRRTCGMGRTVSPTTLLTWALTA